MTREPGRHKGQELRLRFIFSVFRFSFSILRRSLGLFFAQEDWTPAVRPSPVNHDRSPDFFVAKHVYPGIAATHPPTAGTRSFCFALEEKATFQQLTKQRA